MSMFGRPMTREVFITAAVTGAGDTTARSPHVPVTPEQIADAAILAARAGAAVAHCHVRDPKTGQGSRSLQLYQEVFQRIREADVDVVINFTAGMGGDLGFGDSEDPLKLDQALTDVVGPMTRLEHIADLKPEICTLDCGSFNFGDGADFIVMNTPTLLRKMAKRIQELGVKPECEVFDTGHIWFVNKIHKEGLLSDPCMVQLCLGIPFGAPADVTTAKALVDNMPPGAVYSGFAISRDQMPFAALMPMLGGNVRVGLEDNLYLKRGVLATNEQLVSKARGIVEGIGCRILSPDDVRVKLGLVKHDYHGPDYTGRRTAKVIKQPDCFPARCAVPINKVVCIGGGVIGGSWAARFALAGVHVTVLDPDPEAERKVKEIWRNAKSATEKLIPGWNKLHVAALANACGENMTVLSPSAGASVEQALKEADFVQESLPEVEEMKCKCYAQLEQHLRSDVVIASSTSGILPEKLQTGLQHPERLIIAHPFNPVYLIPLVEVVGSAKTDDKATQFASKVYSALGMHPLMLSKKAGETPGFVADRLLEALWREGLHMVNEGVATTTELDAAIAYGPGLRWSFMGTFMLYRLAGGEAGMRHFMKQFGPALKWPWTKLEAPELTEELIEKVVAHSDAQAKDLKKFLPEGAPGSELRQLEQLRDDCLVTALQGLRKHNFAAGAVQKTFEETVYERERYLETHAEDFPSAAKRARRFNGSQTPLFREFRDTVRADWIDYNGHMTESRYLHVFGEGTDALLREIGMTPEAVKESGKSYYTVETHIMNKKEVKAGETLTCSTQILKVDDKRIHLFHWVEKGSGSEGAEMSAETVLATAEQMLLHVDSAAGRACANVNAQVMEKLQAIAAKHSALAKPKETGRFCGAPRT